MNKLEDAYRELAIANRILAREGVVDAYGHVSIRHPDDPARYILSRSLSPALVTPADLMEFNLLSEPIGDSRHPYGERPIHGGAYEARADVNAVVHNHSHAVIPRTTVTDTQIRPVYHMGTGLGQNMPELGYPNQVR